MKKLVVKRRDGIIKLSVDNNKREAAEFHASDVKPNFWVQLKHCNKMYAVNFYREHGKFGGIKTVVHTSTWNVQAKMWETEYRDYKEIALVDEFNREVVHLSSDEQIINNFKELLEESPFPQALANLKLLYGDRDVKRLNDKLFKLI